MKILFDTDFLFALFVPHDAHHQASKHLAPRLKSSERFVSRLVIFETATVLSYKVGQQMAILFVKRLPSLGLNVIDVSIEIERRAWEIFTSQTKKGTSFVDCANLAIVEYYKLNGIATFDEFYPKNLRLPIE